MSFFYEMPLCRGTVQKGSAGTGGDGGLRCKEKRRMFQIQRNYAGQEKADTESFSPAVMLSGRGMIFRRAETEG